MNNIMVSSSATKHPAPKHSKSRTKSPKNSKEIEGPTTNLLSPSVIKSLARAVVAKLPGAPKIQREETPSAALFKHTRQSHELPKSYSKLQRPPASLAAAMLSMPWPPPSHVEQALKNRLKKADEAKLKEKDKNGNPEVVEDGGCCTGQKGPCRCSHNEKSCCSTKSSKSRRPASETQRNPGDPYLPVMVPSFAQVHSAWPGFDHPPLPDWKRKYMRAKPWRFYGPQQVRNDLRFKGNSGTVLSRPTALVDIRALNSTSSHSSLHDMTVNKLNSGTGSKPSKFQSRLQIERLS